MKRFVIVKNLTKNYEDFCAVEDLSFDVEEGEIFGLLGPNGAGKTTTLSILTTLSDMDKGTIIINDLDLIKNKIKIKGFIGMVPQDIAVYKHLNALENVKFFASLYGLKGKALENAAVEALEFVGLSKRQKMKPKQMSGGMQRRLNIACGIAHNPKLIVMDEPTVGVDAQSREHILNSIKILKDRGTTIIYTSHYMNEVEEICDRIAIMDRGKMVACGTKDELVSMVTDSKSFYITTKFPVRFDMEAYKKQLSVMPGIKNITIDENIIRIDLMIQYGDITSIIESVTSNGLPLLNVNGESPNLDMTFLSLTGHDLR